MYYIYEIILMTGFDAERIQIKLIQLDYNVLEEKMKFHSKTLLANAKRLRLHKLTVELKIQLLPKMATVYFFILYVRNTNPLWLNNQANDLTKQLFPKWIIILIFF